MRRLLLISIFLTIFSQTNGQAFTIFDNATTVNSTATGLSFSRSASTGINNIAIGNNSMTVNTLGMDNTAVGTNTLSTQIEGNRNTAVGNDALKNMKGTYWNYLHTIGIPRSEDNVALGYRAMAGRTFTGGTSPNLQIYASNNIAIGSNSLEEIDGSPAFAAGTVDLTSLTNGTYNIAIGQSAMKKTRNAAGNIGIGREALLNTDGYLANYNVSTSQGRDNIGLGFRSLYNNTTGSNNVAIGNFAGGAASAATLSNKLYIGGGTSPLIGGDFMSGKVGINTAITSLASNAAALQVGGNILCVNISFSSDARYKKNIQKINNAFQKINQIEGVTYDWRREDFAEMNFTNNPQIGFIAQEVEKVLPELVITDTKGYKSVDYVKIIPVLLEAIKEINNEKNMLWEDVLWLKNSVNELKAMLEKSSNQIVNGK